MPFAKYVALVLAPEKEKEANECGYYLAAQNLRHIFPELCDESPVPAYVAQNGRVHSGPFLWLAQKVGV
jgi:hypothetical protein